MRITRFITNFVVLVLLILVAINYMTDGAITKFFEPEFHYISRCEPNTGEVPDFTDHYGHVWKGMHWVLDEFDRKCLTDCDGVQQRCEPYGETP